MGPKEKFVKKEVFTTVWLVILLHHNNEKYKFLVLGLLKTGDCFNNAFPLYSNYFGK